MRRFSAQLRLARGPAQCERGVVERGVADRALELVGAIRDQEDDGTMGLDPLAPAIRQDRSWRDATGSRSPPPDASARVPRSAAPDRRGRASSRPQVGGCPWLISTGTWLRLQPAQLIRQARQATPRRARGPAPGWAGRPRACRCAWPDAAAPRPGTASSISATTSAAMVPSSVVAPVHLLAARPGRLAFAALAPRPAGVFLQLVGAIQRGRVGRRGQAGADAEAVDRRAARGTAPADCARPARRWRRCGSHCSPAASRMRAHLARMRRRGRRCPAAPRRS